MKKMSSITTNMAKHLNTNARISREKEELETRKRQNTIARKMSLNNRIHGMDQFTADGFDVNQEIWNRKWKWLERWFPLLSPLGRFHRYWDAFAIIAIMYSVHVNLIENSWGITLAKVLYHA